MEGRTPIARARMTLGRIRPKVEQVSEQTA